MMRFLLAISLLLFACAEFEPESQIHSYAEQSQSPPKFPLYPDPQLTPGSTCKKADELRHPEQIKYCVRDVPTWQKNNVIKLYDERLNYSIRKLDRSEFKVDHYIPLCLGGGNHKENLWPQHKSIYTLTDPIENKLCTLLQRGQISQAEAIEIITIAKNNLEKVADIDTELSKKIAF